MTNNFSANANVSTTETIEPQPPKGKKYFITVGVEDAVGDDSYKWSTRCGELIRCHIPVGYKEWRAVDSFYKDKLWEGLLVFSLISISPSRLNYDIFDWFMISFIFFLFS